jgi:ABC-type molybdate transport system permease subunit
VRSGLDPKKPPTTFAEMEDAAKKISALGKDYHGFMFAGSCGGCTIFEFAPHVWASGGDVLSEDGTQATLDTQEVKDALALYRGMWEDGIIPPSARSDVGNAQSAGFQSGKVGMINLRRVLPACLATFMIPFQAIITPLYTVLQSLNLQNSLVGLTLVYITFQLPFGIFLMRNSFAALPRELEEAAMVDGCGPLTAMWRVMLPVAIPGLITTALLTFFVCWNEFFAALILISDQSKFPLPVALTLIASGNLNTLNWGVLQAGVLVTVVPCIVIYLLLQRYYIGGLLAGALK